MAKVTQIRNIFLFEWSYAEFNYKIFIHKNGKIDLARILNLNSQDQSNQLFYGI